MRQTWSCSFDWCLAQGHSIGDQRNPVGQMAWERLLFTSVLFTTANRAPPIVFRHFGWHAAQDSETEAEGGGYVGV